MNPAIAGWAFPGRQLNARAGTGPQGDPFESRTKIGIGGNDNRNVEIPTDRVRHQINRQLNINALFLRFGGWKVGGISQRPPRDVDSRRLPRGALTHVRSVVLRMLPRVGPAQVHAHLHEFAIKAAGCPLDQKIANR